MFETSESPNQKVCLNCGMPFTGRSLKRFCSISCAQKYIHAHREEWDTGLTQTRDFKCQAPNPNLHKCHGWFDIKGRRHPCERMTTDYRCKECWARHRRAHGSVADNGGGCLTGWEDE